MLTAVDVGIFTHHNDSHLLNTNYGKNAYKLSHLILENPVGLVLFASQIYR